MFLSGGVIIKSDGLCSPTPSSAPHTRSLEARIKEELVAQGLLESEERPGPGGDSEDEVLVELQKRQAELKALSAHNRARKQELLRQGCTVDTCTMKKQIILRFY